MGNKKTTAKKSGPRDVAAIVTEKVIALLEKGTVPWKQPWVGGAPTNLISGKKYRGVNAMLLSILGYSQNYYLTPKQLKELGGAVKAQEKPYMVVYWNFPDKKETSEDPADDEKAAQKAVLRYYVVYNTEQCVGIEGKIPNQQRGNDFDPLPGCEKIVEGMPNPPAIKYKDPNAYYSPLTDTVNMPKRTSFERAEGYYATLFHELVHSTGHHSRLDRHGLIQMEELNGSKHAYSFEELVAELGSCFLQGNTGILDGGQLANSAAYINGWLSVLRDDRRFLISAAASAQKAVDRILGVHPANNRQSNAAV